MRIHLPLHPHHFAAPAAGAAQGPLARIGGELVVVELQGELTWEGDRTGGVVGVLGFDRPDHPTLHVGAHHLLHGKIATLPKPYAVIRRVVGTSAGTAVEGDAADEESDEEREAREKDTPKKARADDEDEDEPPLFADADAYTTPSKAHAPLPSSSSPFAPSSAARDYSSDLSSPAAAHDAWGFPVTPGDEDDDDEDEEEQRAAERRRKRKRESKERTRHYEVVGVVRKKVVFALRPEPLVAATPLPE